MGLRMKVSYKKILGLTIKNTPVVVSIYVLLSIMAVVLPAAELYFFDLMIRAILDGMLFDKVWIVGTYMLLSMLIPGIVRYVLLIVQNYIRLKLDLVLVGSSLEKTTLVEGTYVETGDGVNNAYRATQTQNNGVVQVFFLLNDLILDSAKIVLIILQMSIMGFVTMFFGVILFVITYKIRVQIAQDNMQFYWNLQEDNRYCDCIYDMLNSRNNAGEIKQYNTFDWLFDSYQNRKRINNAKEVGFFKKLQQREGMVELLQIISFAFSVVIFYLLTRYDVLAADVAISAIYAVTKVFPMLSGVVDKLNQKKVQQMIMAEYNRLQSNKNEYDESKQKISDVPEIKVEHLMYRYRNGQECALNDVTFQIHSGEKVVLVGENGSGKSTLLRLLMGIDVPLGGKIEIDGILLKNCLEDFREHITYMGQRYFVYDLAVRDNIVISDTDRLSDEKLYSAIEWAEIDRILDKLEYGLDTEIVQKKLLSGGEWQKVALARMKYRDRNIILMDEPNAAVDAEYEIKLYKKLFALAEGKSMLIVSHRLPICQIADKIIVMYEGRVAEVGNHEELMRKENGIYKGLFETQAELYADRED